MQTLSALCERLEIESEDLDDLVYHLATQQASDVNNAGLNEQLKFICAHLGHEATEARLRQLT